MPEINPTPLRKLYVSFKIPGSEEDLLCDVQPGDTFCSLSREFDLDPAEFRFNYSIPPYETFLFLRDVDRNRDIRELFLIAENVQDTFTVKVTLTQKRAAAPSEKTDDSSIKTFREAAAKSIETNISSFDSKEKSQSRESAVKSSTVYNFPTMKISPTTLPGPAHLLRDTSSPPDILKRKEAILAKVGQRCGVNVRTTLGLAPCCVFEPPNAIDAPHAVDKMVMSNHTKKFQKRAYARQVAAARQESWVNDKYIEAGVGASFFGISIGFSNTTKLHSQAAQQSQTSSDSKLLFVSQEHQVFQVHLDQSCLPLDRDFLARVQGLDDSSPLAICYQVFADYGTHIAQDCSCGGRLYATEIQTTSQAQSDDEQLKSFSNSFRASVGYGPFSAQAGVGVADATHTATHNSSGSATSSVDVLFFGGSISYQDLSTLADWQKSLEMNPDNLEISERSSLVPIYALLNKPELLKARRALENAYFHYLIPDNVVERTLLRFRTEINSQHSILTGLEELEWNPEGVRQFIKLDGISTLSEILRGFCNGKNCDMAVLPKLLPCLKMVLDEADMLQMSAFGKETIISFVRSLIDHVKELDLKLHRCAVDILLKFALFLGAHDVKSFLTQAVQACNDTPRLWLLVAFALKHHDKCGPLTSTLEPENPSYSQLLDTLMANSSAESTAAVLQIIRSRAKDPAYHVTGLSQAKAMLQRLLETKRPNTFHDIGILAQIQQSASLVRFEASFASCLPDRFVIPCDIPTDGPIICATETNTGVAVCQSMPTSSTAMIRSFDLSYSPPKCTQTFIVHGNIEAGSQLYFRSSCFVLAGRSKIYVVSSKGNTVHGFESSLTPILSGSTVISPIDGRCIDINTGQIKTLASTSLLKVIPGTKQVVFNDHVYCICPNGECAVYSIGADKWEALEERGTRPSSVTFTSVAVRSDGIYVADVIVSGDDDQKWFLSRYCFADKVWKYLTPSACAVKADLASLCTFVNISMP